MASFTRSFKPPSTLLSPRRRPGMPARTLSNSSDLSLTPSAGVAHQTDYFVDHPVSSAPSSPFLSPAVGAVTADRVQSTKGSPDISSGSSRSTSHPIAIELPKLRKFNPSGSTGTPPEPLSARGDLPGGYFPMHEDPKSRVHRPHPFFHDPSLSRHQRTSDSITMQAERARNSHASTSPPMDNTSAPLSSYIAPGFHDAPLPVGKYYPSNYEQQHPHLHSDGLQPAPFTDVTSSSKPDSNLLQPRLDPSRGDNPQLEMRRKMQQYQRDVIAQATMVLGESDKTGKSISLNGLSAKDIWRSGSASQKPLSPRLHPLGSPGPVTPMELESSGSGYVDRGVKSHSSLSNDSLAAPGARHTENLS
ncbi:uncharacterized protein MAM_01217 [Metarhizium album ARSEF 1941]|uniref:Uncharacterized protein n=1 Tax=Metarhizium album (strain ARSEF 1941) TaxID=1081103 RepID=A0A0B2X2E4_METAS|nr:uncharacterized protein MAM_01217 [Metarhizium album ARSEF 1941]KHO00439.1 hypothetical protein MAM_01217 [Metarhizium album ARSEF 1941]